MTKRMWTIHSRLVLGLLACTWAGGAAMAVETVYYLRADVTAVTMPDNAVIPVWGFAQDSAFGAEDGTITVPGPTLTVPPGNTLRIVLQNKLTPDITGLSMGCPVCIVIPGQAAAMTPVRFGPMPYPEYEGRIRSMTYETPPGNTTPVEYTWPNMRYGTFLYHSGTHIQCHVQMGLYGVVTQDAAAGEAYPGVPYDREVVLLYSEMDPAFHEAVATGNYGPGKMMSSTIDYNPKYFLINGLPFNSPGVVYPVVDPGEQVLVRFLNAGLKTRVPTLHDPYVQVVAEDGNPYANAREQYSVLLPAGKTTDALLTLETGRAAIYDRMLGLTNAAASPGGMLTYIMVSGPVMILTHPLSQTAIEGDPVSFAVTASGALPLSYQWKKDGVDVPGAIASTYNIGAAAFSDAGSYLCTASNAAGSAVSLPATLTVNEPPLPVTITQHPASITVTVGEAAIFMVGATGAPPLSYQWQKDGADLPGATSPMYSIAAVAPSDAGSYMCVATNPIGSVASNPATLTVSELAPVTITRHPVSQTVVVGSPVSFDVTATGGAPLSYQWQKDGVDLPGATSATYSIVAAAVSDAGSYVCIVTNPVGSVVSNAATLTVNEPVTITLHPVSQTVIAGFPVSFTVAATGTAPSSYQWQKDGIDLPGATSATRSIAAAAVSDAGSYTCVVSNVAGSVTSNAATLTVTTGPWIQITAPIGGETWTRGGTYTITWNSDPSITQVRITLRKGGTQYRMVASRRQNTGSYSLTIANNVLVGTDYQIRIADFNNQATVSSTSDSFTIQ